MEDYQVAIAVSSNPDVLLVKRITAINGDRTTNPNATPGTIDLTQVVDSPTSPNDDAFPANNWPDDSLIGALNAGPVKPGDEIEYTVYFLSSGDAAAESVRICDRIQPGQTFQLGSATLGGADVQIQIGTDPVLNLTAASDVGAGGDRTEFVAAGTNPSNCNLSAVNDNGTLVIDITGAASTGSPALTRPSEFNGSGFTE